ncbi:MAG: glycosyltransferase [Candidatus Omnitrophica bacterium]|nr:glycosyltransferase [Candidatus Omnitrophota bacterium]
MRAAARSAGVKVLLVNKFLYPKGGDAICTLETARVLEANGHEAVCWGIRDPRNSSFPHEDTFLAPVDFAHPGGLAQQVKIALNMLYSREAQRKITEILAREDPDIVHLHNFAHQISPSILDVCSRRGVPVVMTMHDYKLVCPAYTLRSQGEVCERCAHGRYFHCVLRKCIKNSRMKSLLGTAEMHFHHHILRIYKKVDVCIAPSRFMLKKTEEMGLRRPARYVPNFVFPENFSAAYGSPSDEFVYFGRLSEEKGIETLLEAARRTDARVKIIGEGPVRPRLQAIARRGKIRNVKFLGYKQGKELHNEIRTSLAVVVPSCWYENNPRSILEAFALGKPVIGSGIGGIPELVQNGRTGYTFEAGNASALKEKLELARNNLDKTVRMGQNARNLAEKEYNARTYYQRIISVYADAQQKEKAR